MFRSRLNLAPHRNLYEAEGLYSFRMALPWRQRMIFPGYEATMLALEANGVIGLRLIKIAQGGVDAGHEIN
jgi:hypothetical protein